MPPFEVLKSEPEHDRPCPVKLFSTCTHVTMAERKWQTICFSMYPWTYWSPLSGERKSGHCCGVLVFSGIMLRGAEVSIHFQRKSFLHKTIDILTDFLLESRQACKVEHGVNQWGAGSYASSQRKHLPTPEGKHILFLYIYLTGI